MRVNSPNYGLADTLWERQVSRHRMAFLEKHRLVGERPVHLTLLCSVVADGETQAGDGAQFVLVVEPVRIGLSARLRDLLPRLRVYFCLPVHLDSLHPEPGHWAARHEGAP